MLINHIKPNGNFFHLLIKALEWGAGPRSILIEEY